jgi:di/tricarboxylate transporter
MADSTITFLVLGAAVVLFVSNRVPVAVVAVGVSLSLWATGVLEIEQATAGFGDPTVVFIAALFVVSEGLDATGVTAWVGQLLIDRAGNDRARIVSYSAIVVALLTAFITPNAAVAALVPVLVMIAVRLQQPTSRYLMPLAFAAHAGSLLTLTGSPVNVLVSEAARDAGAGQFAFFEFALVGIPLLVGTIVIVVLVGPKLLPDRTPTTSTADLSGLEGTLRKQYRVEGEEVGSLYGRHYGVGEVVVPPRSSLIGRRFRRGMTTDSGELVVVAGLRDGKPISREGWDIQAGDALLVRGTWTALSRQIELDDDVLVVNPPDVVRRQLVPLGVGSWKAIGVLVGMIVLLVTDLAPPAAAGLLAAGALILLRVLTIDQAYRSIMWTTVILVAGMIPLSTAMRTTGAADRISDGLVDLVGDAGAYPLMIAIFVVVVVLGQLISNTATALIVIPVAITAAAELDVAVAPVLLCLNVAASAALLTPVATPANMMVMEPGGYRFGDYWKLGSALLCWYFLIAVVYVPLIWRL